MSNLLPFFLLSRLTILFLWSLPACTDHCHASATLLPCLFLPPLNPSPKPREPAWRHTKNTDLSSHLFNSYLQLKLQNHGSFCLPTILLLLLCHHNKSILNQMPRECPTGWEEAGLRMRSILRTKEERPGPICKIAMKPSVEQFATPATSTSRDGPRARAKCLPQSSVCKSRFIFPQTKH